MDTVLIIAASVMVLLFAARIVLNRYFPPDT
jgi:hypothetical protein